MADDENQQQLDAQDLIRLRANEQQRLEIIRQEREIREQQQASLNDIERDRLDLERLRAEEAIQVEQDRLQTEYNQWQNQNQLRIQEQNEAERIAQEGRDRIDLERFRATEREGQSSSFRQVSPGRVRQRFSNQFESTMQEQHGNGSLNSSIAQMTQELNKTSSIWSHATLRCNPCVPSSGSDILTRFDYDLWKSEWYSLLDTSPSLTEKQKMSLFMRSSGTHLREILTGLSIDQPDQQSSPTPYTEMMTKLEKHFNSEENQKLEAMVFRSTIQEPDEPNVEYIRRLLKKVRFCGFSNLMFELIATVAQNTTDPRLRLKALAPDCDYAKLMSYATTLQLDAKIEKVKESAKLQHLEVNAIQNRYAPYNSSGGSSSWSRPSRDPSRAQDRGASRFKQPINRSRACYRCGEDSFTHRINECPAFHKICLHCGKKGHVSKACKSRAAGIPAVKREPSAGLTNDAKKQRINEIAPEPSTVDPLTEVRLEEELIYE